MMAFAATDFTIGEYPASQEQGDSDSCGGDLFNFVTLTTDMLDESFIKLEEPLKVLFFVPLIVVQCMFT